MGVKALQDIACVVVDALSLAIDLVNGSALTLDRNVRSVQEVDDIISLRIRPSTGRAYDVLVPGLEPAATLETAKQRQRPVSHHERAPISSAIVGLSLPSYLSSVMTARSSPSMSVSVWIRLPRLNRVSPGFHLLSVALPSGVVDRSVPVPR